MVGCLPLIVCGTVNVISLDVFLDHLNVMVKGVALDYYKLVSQSAKIN